MAYPNKQQVIDILNLARRERLDAEQQIELVVKSLPGLARDDFQVVEVAGLRLASPRVDSPLWRD